MSRALICRLFSSIVPLALLAVFFIYPTRQESRATPRKGKSDAPPRTIANSIGMKLVLVPAGKFTMGSPETEAQRSEDETEHKVEITRPYYIGVYAVTQEEYKKVMNKTTSWCSSTGGGKESVKGLDTSRFPVEMVSWHEAREFCEKLTDLERKKGHAREYRMPTEAEWEYACREAGKSKTAFYFGAALSSEQANFNGNRPYGGAAKGPWLERTSKVGLYKPNKLGLYDMHGNVSQWCSDSYDKDYYSNSPNKDPQGSQNGEVRVMRGGSWADIARGCRAAFRTFITPVSHCYFVGFRVVCAVPPKTR